MRTFFNVKIDSARTLLSSLKRDLKRKNRYLYETVDLASAFPMFERVKFYLDQDTSGMNLSRESNHHSGGPSLAVREDEEGIVQLDPNPHGIHNLAPEDYTPENIERLTKYFARDIGESSRRGLTRKVEFIPLVNPNYLGDGVYIFPTSLDVSKLVIWSRSLDVPVINYSAGCLGWPNIYVGGGKNPREAIQAYAFSQRAKNDMPVCQIQFEGTEINKGYEWNDGDPIILPPNKNVPRELENRLWRDFKGDKK